MRPTLAEAFRRAIIKGRGTSPEGLAVTEARVVRIFANGMLQVEASGKDESGRRYAISAIVPVAGEGLRTIHPGQKVAVGWEKRRPVVAIAHTAKRSGAPVPLPRPTAPLVEELFIAPRVADGIVDVHFRNFDDVTPLRLDRFIAASELGSVRWGPLNDRFFVQTFTRFHIFRFDRDPDDPFDAGEDPSDLVSLERTEDLSTNTTTLAVQLWSIEGLPTSITVTPQNIVSLGRGVLVASCLAVDGSLIASYLVSGGAVVSPGNLPDPDFITTTAPFVGQPGVTGGFGSPVVIDATHGVILLSAWDDPTLFAPFWTLLDFNATPRVPVTFYDGAALSAILRPTTWVPGNSFVSGAGPEAVDVQWWFGYSQDPSVIDVRLEPILVLGNDVAQALRVRGWVAWMRQEYLVAIGQVQDPFDSELGQFIAPFGPGEFPVAPSPPFPITDQSAALIIGPDTGAVMRALYPLQRPATGLSSARTLKRVIWRAPSAVAFVPAQQGLNVAGADSPGFATLLEDGTTVQVSPTLRASVGQRGLVPVLTDFLFQLDNPAVALPAQAEVNFFVDAWEFGGATTLNTAATDFPVELGELEEAKPLADLPEGVVHPTSFGLFSLYVNNDSETLEAAGFFEELPSVTPAVV